MSTTEPVVLTENNSQKIHKWPFLNFRQRVNILPIKLWTATKWFLHRFSIHRGFDWGQDGRDPRSSLRKTILKKNQNASNNKIQFEIFGKNVPKWKYLVLCRLPIYCGCSNGHWMITIRKIKVDCPRKLTKNIQQLSDTGNYPNIRIQQLTADWFFHFPSVPPPRLQNRLRNQANLMANFSQSFGEQPMRLLEGLEKYLTTLYLIKM